jgi:F0F1-type ATP synthase assembly protein I
MFLVSVIDMSWRLAIVVLIPVIGGFEFDRRLNTSPWLTIVGFLVAMGGMYVVTKQTLVKATALSNKKGQK